jgi:hypothetical protein
VCVAPRSVTDLLAEQPEEALLAMRERVQRELSRLTLEAMQIDEALTKVTRRNRGGRRPRGGAERLTREQVFEVVERASGALTPSEVQEALTAQGVSTSLNSVRNHMDRLVKQNGWLVRLDDGRFTVSPEKAIGLLDTQVSADDDVPF